LQHNFVSGVTENCKFKEEIEELKLQLSLSRIGVNDMKSWNEDLEETAKQYREQRDYFAEIRYIISINQSINRSTIDQSINLNQSI